MSGATIEVPYNETSKPLERALARVRRPGDFFVQGAVEAPMPRVHVRGAGVLSFPVPEAQVKALIALGERAPYGRGAETLVDTSVRRVWQLPPSKLDVGGKSLPVTRGNRVCLVYNLLQRPSRQRKPRASLIAPDYGAQTAVAAELLRTTFAGTAATTKIAWLLEHQYSPASLSFGALKNADRARCQLLIEAATRADCAVHLGIVHIEESGPAEYTGYGAYDWEDDGEVGDEEEDASSDDFEVVEVADAWAYIDHWRTLEDLDAGFGPLPLRDGEVLPAGALDNEAPDEQRLLEASGNEGVTFERAYHRAALVLWPRGRFVDVLLQAGVRAALPYLEARAQSIGTTVSTDGVALVVETRRVVEAWVRRVGDASGHGIGEAGTDDEDIDDEDGDGHGDDTDRGDDDDDADGPWGPGFGEPADGTSSAEVSRMLALLRRLGDADLLERFVRGVVTAGFDDAQAAALAEAGETLGAQRCVDLLPRMIERNMRKAPRGCVHLLACLMDAHGAPTPREWKRVLREIATAIVDGLPALQPAVTRAAGHRVGGPKRKPVDGSSLADLLGALAALEAPGLRAAACAAVSANGDAFDPRDVIVPALQALHGRSVAMRADTDATRLWLHAADALLARSEYPPEPPQDWRQETTL